MIPVIVESPFAGKGDARVVDAAYKRAYLAACLYDCYMRGESPMASHALGPLSLDDDDPIHRQLGMTAVEPWRRAAKKTVVYQDLGTSGGMSYGISAGKKLEDEEGVDHVVEYRLLGRPWGPFKVNSHADTEDLPAEDLIVPEARETGDLPDPEEDN